MTDFICLNLTRQIVNQLNSPKPPNSPKFDADRNLDYSQVRLYCTSFFRAESFNIFNNKDSLIGKEGPISTSFSKYVADENKGMKQQIDKIKMNMLSRKK